MTLANRVMRDDFLKKLNACEDKLNIFQDFEQKFIKDMRTRFNSREDASDLGLPQWEPTVKQLNYLTSLYST